MISLFCAGARVSADPGDGILIGDTTLKPYAESTAMYDSNVSHSGTNDPDTSLGFKLGISAAHSWKVVAIGGEIWGQVVKYDQHPARDYDRIGESLRISTRLFDQLNVSLAQEYSTSIEDADSLTDVFGKIRNFGGGISFDRQLSEKTAAAFRYERAQAGYDVEQLYDWHRDSGTLGLDYRMTDKTTATLSTRLSFSYSEGSGDAFTYGEYVCFQTEFTDKTSAGWALGWQYQDAQTVISIPSTEGSLAWAATEDTTVSMNWTVRINPAIEYRDNYIVCSAGHLRIGIQLTDTVNVEADGAYHQNRYWNDVSTSQDNTGRLVEDVIQAGLGASYTVPTRFLTVFIRGNYTEKVTALDIREYGRYHVSFGLRLEY